MRVGKTEEVARKATTTIKTDKSGELCSKACAYYSSSLSRIPGSYIRCYCSCGPGEEKRLQMRSVDEYDESYEGTFPRARAVRHPYCLADEIDVRELVTIMNAFLEHCQGTEFSDDLRDCLQESRDKLAAALDQ